jgi:serine/threonine protein kinase
MDHPGTDSPGVITLNRPVSDGIEIPLSFPGKLLGKYRDIRVIGSGGMAIVYRAMRVDDDREVAVKIPFSADEESGRTFLNEILLWRDLDHPNIAQILDHNIFPVPYVEIEYIPRTLRDMTRPVSPGRAVSIISDVASALAYAHEKGVIHRDIKPGNVLVTNEGTCKLTDWGLSRSLSKRDETRNLSFSLQYATPEQLAPARYGTGDERIDLYQLGVLFYELLCGRPPYDTDSIGDMFQNIQENRFSLPSEFSSRLAGYDLVIIRALKADPSERFSNIREFLDAIESVNITK